MKLSCKYILIDLLKIFKIFVINNYASLFSPSLILSVISPVREICFSNRCLKYFDRVFVSVSSIKLM